MKSSKQNKENSSESPRGSQEKEEHKVAEEEHRGTKNKPRIMDKNLPAAFSNHQIKYKSSKNEQYIKQIKDKVHDDSHINSKNTLDPLAIPRDRQHKMNKVLNGNKDISNSKMNKSHSSGFDSFKNIDGESGLSTISSTDLKLQQMVSLAIIKSNSVSGPIKKVLHVPTFTIY